MNYEAYFDELNVRTVSAVETYNNGEKEKKGENLDDLLDFIEDALLSGIALGITSANDELGTDYAIEFVLPDNEVNDLIYTEIKGETWVERLLNKRSESEDGSLSANDIKRLVETETHRVINKAKYFAGQTAVNVDGIIPLKYWETMDDNKVRDTHRYLNGMVVPLNERFYTNDGDSALVPGDFSNAENNIHCRCVVKYIRQGSL